MTQKEFIQNVLIGEIGDVVSHHQYLSFALISAGIELLGTCIESPINSFHIWGKSELRFKSAINQLFPTDYKQHDKLLYTELRCGMNHSVMPKSKIVLSERKHGHKNLSIYDTKLLLVAEDFYDDFKKACEEVIAKIDRVEIKERFALNLV